MTQVSPMPVISPGSADLGRPGQQLLPGYVVKLLKTLKIPFGTDRTINGVDVDPSINLIGHIIDCLGALRDVNKVYRAKGSLASRSVGTRTMFGFTAELGNILLDAITFDPPNDLSDSSLYYGQVATSILNVFPEIAAQITPSTGKVLIHHTALKASATMAMESIKMVLKAFPAGAWTTDRTGALPLHWITHNQYCNSEMINYLINANPKGPWVADCDGYLPLHWAVNQDQPNIDVVAALIAANQSASAKACLKGSLPLHWCVNRDAPNMQVVRALIQVHADGVRTFDKTGWLPLHQCVNRSNISLDSLSLLIELYPQGLQCPNINGQLPMHRALDQLTPSVEALAVMMDHFPGGSKVADDEGYLPIHLALDCAQPNPVIAKMLLDCYPEAAFHKSKDGLLPIHCIISSMNPVVEIIQYLLVIFPDSTESMAVDVIPVDESADPETWTGEWIEKRWTPLSRAIDRGLDAIVFMFRDAQNTSKNYAAASASSNQNRGLIGGPSVNGGGQQGGMMLNTATPKTLLPQNRPPINNLSNSNSIHRGPSTSSNEGPQAGNRNNQQLVLGGNLDSPDGNAYTNEDGDEYDVQQFAPLNNQMMSQTMPGQRNLPMNIQQNMSGGGGSNIMRGQLNPDGSLVGGPMNGRPGTGPAVLNPGHSMSMNSLNRGPVARGDKYSDVKNRERDRQSSRDRDGGHRDREHRSSDRERRHRSSSRNHRSDRDRDRRSDRDYDDDRERDRRDRHRSSSRGGEHRRESRGSGEHRESRGHRDRDREHNNNSRNPPPQRIYENTEFDDLTNEDDVNGVGGMGGVQQGMQQMQFGGDNGQPYYNNDGGQQQQMGPKGGRMMPPHVNMPPPSSQPPQSLMDAAIARPGSRRGPNDNLTPSQHSNHSSNLNTPNHNNNRERGNSGTFNRDSSSEQGEYNDTTTVDIIDGNFDSIRQRPISVDDLV